MSERSTDSTPKASKQPVVGNVFDPTDDSKDDSLYQSDGKDHMTAAEEKKLLAISRRKNGKSLDSEDAKYSWMSDSEAAACMLCDNQFGIFVRKHHCRRCGILVCGTCSANRLKFSNTKSEKRVCDDCFNAVKKLKDLGIMGSKQDLVEEVVLPSAVNIPSWMFAFKPFVAQGYNVAIGQVYVRIYEGRDLPAMDFTGLSDPYVVVRVGDVEMKTSVVPQCLNPKWSAAEFLIPVTSALDTVVLNVFDQDLHSADDKMGTVEIPLSSLAHEEKVREWFDLKLEHGVAKSIKSKLKEKDGVLQLPRILVEIQYTYSKAGEFFSYYTPPAVKPAPQPDFQINILYSAIFRLLDLLAPVFWILGEITQVIFWTDVFKSMSVLLIFCFCTLNPWLYPPLFLSITLYCMAWKYIETQLDGSFLVGMQGSVPAKLKEIEELKKKLDEVENQPDAKKKETSVQDYITGIASKSLIITGMQDTLKWAQNTLVYTCDMIEFIYSFFNWKNQFMSQITFFSLLALDLYSLFFNFKYAVFLIGGYVLTMYTVPGIVFLWLITSTSFYFTRPRPVYDNSKFVELDDRATRSSIYLRS